MSESTADPMADLRHDLRTPIGHVLGYGEMVVEELGERGLEDLAADVEKMRTAGHRLLALIDERLNAAALGVSTDGGTPPRAAPPSADSAPPPAAPATPRQHLDDDWADDSAMPHGPAETGRLLVVDDDADNRDMLARRLEQQGHTVLAVAGGAEALAELARREFDLVLLDILMPGMDGFEVLAHIKGEPRTHHLPVIMISALDDLEGVVRCIEMGAADYLSKPFNPTLLRARVGACLRDKRARDLEQRFTAELQESYRRLQELERLRDDLTHMIVHDLRTPLTSLLSGLQTVSLVGDLNESQREMLDIALDGGQTLLGMINDLLDVEKMEAGALPLDYARLSVAELVARAAAQVDALARGNGLTLVQEVPPDPLPFEADEDKLRRTLVNLLGNAIKFTPPGGTLTVAARPGEEGGTLFFSVSDTGEGIPPEAFGRIFEKFGQVESRRRGRQMSTGLGLTFCRLAVEAHGGRIGVESAPGRGSTFSFTIPLSAGAASV